MFQKYHITSATFLSGMITLGILCVRTKNSEWLTWEKILSGTIHSKELYTVYRNDFSGMQDMNDTCQKITHIKMIDRGFTVMYTVKPHAPTPTQTNKQTNRWVSIHSLLTCTKFNWHLTFRNLTTA